MIKGKLTVSDVPILLQNKTGQNIFVLSISDHYRHCLANIRNPGMTPSHIQIPDWPNHHDPACSNSYEVLAWSNALRRISSELMNLTKPNSIQLGLVRFPIPINQITLSIDRVIILVTCIAAVTPPDLRAEAIDHAIDWVVNYKVSLFYLLPLPIVISIVSLLKQPWISGNKSLKIYQASKAINQRLTPQNGDDPASIVELYSKAENLSTLMSKFARSSRGPIVLEIKGPQKRAGDTAMAIFLDFIAKMLGKGVHLLLTGSTAVVEAFRDLETQASFNYGIVGEPGFRKIHFL